MLQTLRVIENGKLKGVIERIDGYTDYYTAEEYTQLEKESEQVPRLSEAESRKARATLAAAKAAWAAAID